MNTDPRRKPWGPLLAAIVLVAAALLFRGAWWPQVARLFESPAAVADDDHSADDPHAGHGHEGHDDASSLELSERALRNIGYRPLVIKLQQFSKSTTVPAMVVERPGRSQLDVTAPMTGVVTKVYIIEGEAVAAGQSLFDIRLTHEDLVTAQRDFLRSAEELDVVDRELERFKSIGDGVIAGKRILERQYEKQKLEAAIHAQREGLLLHGLTDEHVAGILKTRSLLKLLTIDAPQGTGDCAAENEEHLFSVQALDVRPGQQVTVGSSLCTLSDHCRLYIEGKAFEEDAEVLNRAATKNQKVAAVQLSRGAERDAIDDLEILYVADSVESDTRALHFYIDLPNHQVRDQQKDGHRFIGWKYKPGERFEVRIPVRHFDDRIVLPVDAVVTEGAEAFVFQRNGDHFDRVEVHVEDRDGDQVVVANDGSLYPGDVIAASGAFDMHLTMKNKAGGGIDPHAGHSH